MPLISIHIPKTGGTSFSDCLYNHYKHKLLLDYGLSKEVGCNLMRQGAHDCVHGHFVADKYMSITDAEYVLWLRNPIQRLFSHYYFWKKNKYPHSLAWRRFYFEEWSFAEFALSPAFRDQQSKYVGSLDINNAKVVGITEFFNESMELFNATLGMNTDVSVIPQHRKNKQLAEGMSYEIKDKKLEAAILEYHKNDYQLYLKGLTIFRERYDRLPNRPSPPCWSRTREKPGPISEPLSLQSFIKDKGVEKLIGTYYYGDGWPINMWDSFRRDVADTYLDKMKADGFNTVILLIPGFVAMLREQSEEHYNEFIDDLRFIMGKISDRNLHCIFRLGFAWDGFPIKGDRGAFNFSVLAGGEERALAKAVFKEIWEIANEYAGFLYGFITWEDILMFAWHRATKATDDMRRAYAQELGYESKLGMTPTSDAAEFNDYIEFIDVKFSELFYDLKQVFPRLSAEVRVDITPFNDLDGNPQQYIHNRQFVETDCDIIGTYFATYMVHGEPSAERAKISMELAHRALLQAAPQKKIFIDQLLLVIKEKEFDHFPILSEVELQKFIDWLPEWLDKYSCGYATWSFSDYLWDITFNGSFRYGFMGWTLEGSPVLVANQRQRYVELNHGDSIQGGRIEHFSPWIKNGVILVEAEIDEGSELRVELSNEIALSFNSAAFVLAPTNNGKVAIAEFTGQTEYIKVSLSGGSAKLFRIGVGKEIASTGGYGINLDKSYFAYMMEGLNKKWGGAN